MVGAVPGERVCWGLGRETPGLEPLDVPAIFLHFNLNCAEAAMFLGVVTVRPFAVANLLFGNYHAWVEGVKIFRINLRPLLHKSCTACFVVDLAFFILF